MRYAIPASVQQFCELLNCTGKFYLWVYDEQLSLCYSNAEQEEPLDQLFTLSGCKAHLQKYARSGADPLILWSAMGLLWFAAFEKGTDSNLTSCYVIGPMSSAEAALSDQEDEYKKLRISVKNIIELNQLVRVLPMMSLLSIVPYTQMLHYCVTGEHIPQHQIQFQSGRKGKTKITDELPHTDRHRHWMLEQKVLAHVRNGDLDYQEDWEQVARLATGVRVEDQDMLTRAKMSVITFIGSCVRAAIEGGLSPETAHTRGDTYMRDLMKCTTLGDARALNHAMYEDFIRCVHTCRTNPHYSRQIQSCCDYIEQHAEETVSTAFLAERVGYSEYYLTRKFKEETGMSIVNYTKFVKTEQARQMLEFTTLSIQQISEKLGFCSRSYFTKVFHTITGVTPGEYRDKHQRL